MRTLLSFIAILLLATSSFPIGFADTTQTDSQNIESIEQPIVKTRKVLSISLEESVGITSEPPRKKQINKILDEKKDVLDVQIEQALKDQGKKEKNLRNKTLWEKYCWKNDVYRIFFIL